MNLVRYTPVFTGGAWQNMYMVRIQNYILVVMTFITTSYAKLEAKINNFKLSFIQSRLEIPTEVLDDGFSFLGTTRFTATLCQERNIGHVVP